jgi:D-3-phosphoglycerate dehydrogenase
MATIRVTSPSFSRDETLCRRLEERFGQVELNRQGVRYSGESLVRFLHGADGAIVGLEPMTREVIEALPDLKIISKYGVGLNNLDMDAIRERGIAVGWTGGTNKRSVAEQALCFMLGLCRNVFMTSRMLAGGRWHKHGGFQLSGRTVGIVGCGHTGSEVARLLPPLGCTVLIADIVNKRAEAEALGATQVELDELLRRADIVTLHVPLTEATRNMINADTLRAMKDTAFLINLSRGEIVDQPALRHALAHGVIAGAALDVFESEPCDDMELLAMDNLVATPHIGGNAREAVLAMGTAAIDHLEAFFHKESSCA